MNDIESYLRAMNFVCVYLIQLKKSSWRVNMFTYEENGGILETLLFSNSMAV